MKKAYWIARGMGTVTLFACAALALFLAQARTAVQSPAATQEFGVTFSTRAASAYGVDPWTAFAAVLDELRVRRIRFPVYWDESEPAPGAYDFANVDPYLDAAAARGATVTLVVGMKVPRWPECQPPSWVDPEDPGVPLLAYLETVVTRYKDHPAVVRWQIENEPHFPFGVCPAPDLALLAEEIALVRKLDPDTPIQLTVSGEQEPWAATAGDADVLGVSLYRFAWNRLFGLVVFPHPPEFYRVQAATVAHSVDSVVISELQAEPWFVNGQQPEGVTAQYALFPAERLAAHAAYARRTGLPEIYLWGVEWWYALAQQGETRLWETAKDVIGATDE